ncbi:hypothetical protein CUC08_Gglean002334 [Alternaria sp. MG1]|nr:hypothetical protein CUC08_Gglean002334 [Alternaria sp. MG1]
MANAHELQHYRAHTDTSFAPPSSEPENDFRLSDRPRQQRYNSDSDARHHNARGIDPFDSDDGQSPTVVSPNSTLSSVDDAAIEEVPRTPPIERSRPFTHISSGERSRDDDAQDARLDAFSQIHLITQDTCSDPQAHQARSTKDKFVPSKDCPTRRDIRSSRFTWLNVTMIFICSVSTALSAVFVVLASKGQRYGDYIGNNPDATLSISAAILWTSVVAKTIELTFVTGFVAFLGQVLSRRALAETNSQGVTLSELTIWRWVIQPGTLIAQPEIAKYTGMSTLGILTLLSTVLSTLYVTAATALVQPISQQSDWRVRSMCGWVQTDFANINYIGKLCPTPNLDKDEGASTCMQIDSAGKSYYNLAQYIGRWADMVKAGESFSTIQEDRPAWIGIPYANTTVVPQWVNVIDTAEASRKYQRVINNVTLALPHVGVTNAARDKRNIMPQSEMSDTIETYSLWASVPSPVINVLCVHLNKTELQPLVYEAWPNNEVVNFNSWSTLPGIRDNATTKNRTVVDELFGWDLNDATTLLWPPVFGKFPMPFNTILNHTSYIWGKSAIYLLGQGGPREDDADLTGVYPLCKLQTSISTRCSTRQSVSVSGSKAEALCEERASDMTFSNHASIEFVSSTTQRLANWRDVGSDWANSLSLGDGLMDGNNSLSRTLMMLALQPENSNPMSMEVELNQRLPSLAETLAIGASDTLLTGLQSAPFVEFWVSERR